MKIYKCDICGNEFVVIKDSKVIPMCCAQNMREVLPNINDTATKEKHVPIYKEEENFITVFVGSTVHPSSKDHYIEWIILETNKGFYKKDLKPGEIPSASFVLAKDEVIENIYAYCNIHGLWSIK